MKHLLIRILLFLSPFLVIFLFYVITDPFKIIYNYDNYYEKEDSVIYKNRDYVSTEMYLKNSTKYNYDSFIFGSSTASFFPLREWRQYIDTTANIFYFDASRENIVGIWSKIKFIHETGNQIENALLIFDNEITFEPFRNEDFIYMKHYNVLKTSRLKFHYKSALTFFNIRFISTYLHYKISKRFYPYMDLIFEDRYYYHDLVSNELIFESPIKELKSDSIGYYISRRNVFYARDSKIYESKSQITEDHIRLLQEIYQIFSSNKTNYRIVIAPNYSQTKFNKKDLDILNFIFSERYVFDFSGINEYTNEVSNYYDAVHFKGYVGAQLLKDIYADCYPKRIHEE